MKTFFLTTILIIILIVITYPWWSLIGTKLLLSPKKDVLNSIPLSRDVIPIKDVPDKQTTSLGLYSYVIPSGFVLVEERNKNNEVIPKLKSEQVADVQNDEVTTRYYKNSGGITIMFNYYKHPILKINPCPTAPETNIEFTYNEFTIFTLRPIAMKILGEKLLKKTLLVSLPNQKIYSYPTEYVSIETPTGKTYAFMHENHTTIARSDCHSALNVLVTPLTDVETIDYIVSGIEIQ